MNPRSNNPADGLSESLKIGQIAVLIGDGQLRTLLGSCAGLALYCTRRPIGGLAHILLPDSGGRSHLPGKYVDTAVPELIRRVRAAGGRELRAKIAGGANVLNQSSLSTIGDQVISCLEKCLADEKIPVAGSHCGGTRGRRMLFWPGSGKVRIEWVGGESCEI